jgi:hypothetical protein
MLAFKTEDLFKRPEVRQYCLWSALVYLICTKGHKADAHRRPRYECVNGVRLMLLPTCWRGTHHEDVARAHKMYDPERLRYRLTRDTTADSVRTSSSCSSLSVTLQRLYSGSRPALLGQPRATCCRTVTANACRLPTSRTTAAHQRRRVRI